MVAPDHHPERTRWVTLGLEVPAAIVLFLLMVHVSVNAILRAYFDAPIIGTLEYTQFWYLPIIALLGFVTAQRRSEHVEARLLFDRFPLRAQRWVQFASSLLALVMCAGFAYFSLQAALENFAIRLTGGIIGLVIWPVTFLVPVCFALLAAQLTADSVKALRTGRAARRTGDAPTTKAPPTDTGA